LTPATATPEPLMSAPEATDVYMSMKLDLRLVKTPKYPVYGPSGAQVDMRPGEVLAFREGVLRIPHEGSVTLEDGRQIDAADARSFIERHRLLGDQFMGFWRVDPVAPPIGEQELEAIMDAALNGDAETLQRIVDQETAGWGREVLIRRAQAAIEKIERVRAEFEAAQAKAK
jgi:hypothetical protein